MLSDDLIDEIREMFRNDDGSCKLSRSDVLRIAEKLALFARQETSAKQSALTPCACGGERQLLTRCQRCRTLEASPRTEVVSCQCGLCKGTHTTLPHNG